jgi:hypothetical protein
MLLTLKDLGALVDHTIWGRGKVVDVNPPHATVHFTSLIDTDAGPRRKVQENTVQLTRSKVQGDPTLDLIELGPAKPPKKTSAAKQKKARPVQQTLDQSIDWFAQAYPHLFVDAKFVEQELRATREAAARFAELFGDGQGEAMLAAGSKVQIAAGLDALFEVTRIPPRFDKTTEVEAARHREAAAHLLQAVLAFVRKPGDTAMAGLVEATATLPAPADGSRLITWPNVTVLPMLASPAKHILVRPGVVEKMAQRMEFSLKFTPSPSWASYEALQRMSAFLLQRLVPLGAKDYIDVAAFMWVTRDLE